MTHPDRLSHTHNNACCITHTHTHKHVIREELYPMPYGSIDWNAARSQIAKEDLYYPHPMIQVGEEVGAASA